MGRWRDGGRRHANAGQPRTRRQTATRRDLGDAGIARAPGCDDPDAYKRHASDRRQPGCELRNRRHRRHRDRRAGSPSGRAGSRAGDPGKRRQARGRGRDGRVHGRPLSAQRRSRHQLWRGRDRPHLVGRPGPPLDEWPRPRAPGRRQGRCRGRFRRAEPSLYQLRPGPLQRQRQPRHDVRAGGHRPDGRERERSRGRGRSRRHPGRRQDRRGGLKGVCRLRTGALQRQRQPRHDLWRSTASW